MLWRGTRAQWCRWSLALAVAAGLGVAGGFPDTAVARQSQAAAGTISLDQLPAQAQATYHLILSGGPFPYPKDGVVFGNRERQLPRQARGYYHEYTVKTPGSRDRGARRIVCGGLPPTQPEACYYTDDHYASYRRIAP